jgi:hypothetical protein
VTYTPNGVLFNHKTEIILLLGKSMEVEIIMLSEIARLKETNILCFFSYVGSRFLKKAST